MHETKTKNEKSYKYSQIMVSFMFLLSLFPFKDSSPSRKLYSHLLRAYSAKLDKYYSLVQRMKPPTKKSIILENRKVEEVNNSV